MGPSPLGPRSIRWLCMAVLVAGAAYADSSVAEAAPMSPENGTTSAVTPPGNVPKNATTPTGTVPADVPAASPSDTLPVPRLPLEPLVGTTVGGEVAGTSAGAQPSAMNTSVGVNVSAPLSELTSTRAANVTTTGTRPPGGNATSISGNETDVERKSRVTQFLEALSKVDLDGNASLPSLPASTNSSIMESIGRASSSASSFIMNRIGWSPTHPANSSAAGPENGTTFSNESQATATAAQVNSTAVPTLALATSTASPPSNVTANATSSVHTASESGSSPVLDRVPGALPAVNVSVNASARAAALDEAARPEANTTALETNATGRATNTTAAPQTQTTAAGEASGKQPPYRFSPPEGVQSIPTAKGDAHVPEHFWIPLRGHRENDRPAPVGGLAQPPIAAQPEASTEQLVGDGTGRAAVDRELPGPSGGKAPPAEGVHPSTADAPTATTPLDPKPLAADTSAALNASAGRESPASLGPVAGGGPATTDDKHADLAPVWGSGMLPPSATMATTAADVPRESASTPAVASLSSSSTAPAPSESVPAAAPEGVARPVEGGRHEGPGLGLLGPTDAGASVEAGVRPCPGDPSCSARGICEEGTCRCREGYEVRTRSLPQPRTRRRRCAAHVPNLARPPRRRAQGAACERAVVDCAGIAGCAQCAASGGCAWCVASATCVRLHNSSCAHNLERLSDCTAPSAGPGASDVKNTTVSAEPPTGSFAAPADEGPSPHPARSTAVRAAHVRPSPGAPWSHPNLRGRS